MNENQVWQIKRRDQIAKFFQIEPWVQEDLTQENTQTLLTIDPAIKSLQATDSFGSFFQNEKEWMLKKRAITRTDDSREIDFVLHWKMNHSNRSGFFPSFKQNMFPATSKHSKLLQVAYNFEQNVTVPPGEFPYTIPIEFSFTPTTQSISEVRINVNKDGDDQKTPTWIGKVHHRIRDLQSTQRITLNALVHQIGVYDLNQITVEILLNSANDMPQYIRMKDEMLVNVSESEAEVNLLDI